MANVVYTPDGTRSTTSCLATARYCERGGKLAMHFDEPNTSFPNIDVSFSHYHRVMDMMERDLGVVFTAEERQGIVQIGSADIANSLSLHLSVLPFRVFREYHTWDGHGTKHALWDSLIEAGAPEWGSFITLHLVAPTMRGLRFISRADQQWWLLLLNYGGNNDNELSINTDQILARIAYLFPPLIEDHMPKRWCFSKRPVMGTFRESGDYNFTGELAQISKELRAEFFETYSVSHSPNIPELVSIASRIETAFQRVKSFAITCAEEQRLAAHTPVRSFALEEAMRRAPEVSEPTAEVA